MSWPTFCSGTRSAASRGRPSIGLLAYCRGPQRRRSSPSRRDRRRRRRPPGGVALWFVLRRRRRRARRWSRPRSRPGRGGLEKQTRAAPSAGPRLSVVCRLRGLVALDGCRAIAHMNGDAARLRSLGWGCGSRARRVEARGDGLRVDALGQRQRAAEGTIGALDAHVALALVLVLGLASPDTVKRCPRPRCSRRHRRGGEVGLEDEVVLVSTRSNRRIRAAAGPVAVPEVGVSKKVVNSRFIRSAAN